MYHWTPSSTGATGDSWPVGRRLAATGGAGAKTPRSGNGSAASSGGNCASWVRSSSSTPVSTGGCAPGGSRGTPGDSVGRPAEEGRRASRTVITFAHVLHLTLRTFPRTLSSAMEYLV